MIQLWFCVSVKDRHAWSLTHTHELKMYSVFFRLKVAPEYKSQQTDA